jgi:hypothetical protein
MVVVARAFIKKLKIGGWPRSMLACTKSETLFQNLDSITRAKRAEGMAQAVEYMPPKCKANFKLQYCQKNIKIPQLLLTTNKLTNPNANRTRSSKITH